MPRLTSLLARTMRQRTITRVIVRTKKLEDIRAEIIDLIPEFFPSRIAEFFPRISDLVTLNFGIIKTIPRLNLLSFPATPSIIEDLAQDQRIEAVYLDREFHALREFRPLETARQFFEDKMRKRTFTTTFVTKRFIGADIANAQGFTGRGVTLAVADTGGTNLHRGTPHLEFHTTIRGVRTDENGHGEWVAACSGGKPFLDPFFKVPTEGMAPDARLISIKCLGTPLGTGRESDVIEAIVLAGDLGADVLNLSLGSEQVPPSPEEDPQCIAIDDLVARGIIVCVAAGNSGPKSGSINSPGSCPNALTVGAWDTIRNELAGFSSRGPTPWGDVKPDVIAPGVDIDAPIIGILDSLGDKVKQRASYISGTSMATPHVEGLVALMKQASKAGGKEFTTQNVKEMMSRLGRKNNDVGWGLITWEIFEKYSEDVFGIKVSELAREMR